jgi:hypothetical protein
VLQVDKEASQTRDYRVANVRDASRGSPRSVAAQRTLARNDNYGGGQECPPYSGSYNGNAGV